MTIILKFSCVTSTSINNLDTQADKLLLFGIVYMITAFLSSHRNNKLFFV
uniref:Uncharacterized protein n=1 Tax=Rhizophagus irregularis (strain DAOM 181602 / DAOM 197198 / MUCL 43194) TaxID=747089 RepID=U9TEV2_RHIID